MRETGTVRKRFEGDVETSKTYTGQALTMLGAMKNQMKLQGLDQLTQQQILSDGTVIRLQSVYGQDTITVDTSTTGSVSKEEKTSEQVSEQYLKNYYNGTVASPCTCQGLYTILVAAPAITTTYTTQVLPPPINSIGLQGQAQANTLHVYVSGVEVETYTGTFTYNFTTTGVGVQFVYSNWPGGPLNSGQFHQTPIGSFANGTDDTTSGVLVSSFAATPIPGYLDAAHVAQAAGGSNTLVLSNDGTQLASVPYQDIGSFSKTDYPADYDASGTGHRTYNSAISIYDMTPTAFSSTTFISQYTLVYKRLSSFATPANICLKYPTFAASYGWTGQFNSPSGTIFNPYYPAVFVETTGSTPTTTTYAFRYDSGSALYNLATATAAKDVIPELLPEYQTAWASLASIMGIPDLVRFGATAAEDIRTAVIRERARVKTCSDNIKTNLRNGVMQDQIKSVMRVGHQFSEGTYQQVLMTASAVNGSFIDGDDTVLTRSVTLSYSSTDTDGNPITRTETIDGTQRTSSTECTSSTGDDPVTYTTTTYVNWFPNTPTTGSTGTALDFTFQRDTNLGMAQMWNGIIIAGAANIAATFDSGGSVYTPPYIQSSDTRTYSYPQIYVDYREEVKRLYRANSGNVSWLDSAYLDGEMIDIFPMSKVHSELGDLGLFAQTRDTKVNSKLSVKIDLKVTYRYSYLTGNWKFVSAADIDPPLIVSYLEPSGGLNITKTGNMIFRSRVKAKEEWPDVAEEYKTQMGAIKDNPASLPMYALLDSL